MNLTSNDECEKLNDFDICPKLDTRGFHDIPRNEKKILTVKFLNLIIKIINTVI